MRSRLAIAAAVGFGALCAGPPAAGAHPLLLTAAPAPEAIVPGAPSAVTLAFSEAAVARGSAVTIGGAKLGPIKATDGGRQFAASLPRGVKPGVYKVQWVVLGQDGHTVSGSFAFAVAEPNGAPPPGASGLGSVGGGRGGTAAGEGIVSLLARWAGILAASSLWGGALLAWLLGSRLWPLFEVSVPVLAASAGFGLLQQATAGAGGFDLGLLTASGSGVSALARAGVALVGLLALRRPGVRISVALGGAELVAFGLSGHVLAQGSALAALVMVVHVLAAGAWAGGMLTLLALVSRPERWSRSSPSRRSCRD